MRPSIRVAARLALCIAGWIAAHAVSPDSRAFAQDRGAGTWTGGGPKAKAVFSITVDSADPNLLYAGALGSGVFKSTDGGLTWDPSTTGLTNTYVRAVAIYPPNHSIVFAGTNDGLFKSTDAGISWTHVLATSHSVRGIAFDPVNPGIVYAGSLGEGLFRSSDQGATWFPMNQGLIDWNVRTVASHPFVPNVALAGSGTNGGIHLTSNGGLYWALTADPDGRGAVSDLKYDPLNAGRIYAAMFDRGMAVSSDGGTNWVRINSGLTDWGSRALAVADTFRYVGTDSSGVYTTTSLAPVWTQRNAGLPNLLIRALATSPASPMTVYAGTDGAGLYKSTDAGGAWTPLNTYLTDTTGRTLLVRNDPSGTVICGTGFGDGIWTSADGGGNWNRASWLDTRNSVLDLGETSFGTMTYAAIYGSGVYASSDGGQVWTVTDTLTLGNRFVRALATNHTNPADILVGTGNGTWRTTNAGASWFASNTGIPYAASVRTLVRNPANPLIVYAGTDSSGAYRTTDGGASWITINNGLTHPYVHVLAVDPFVQTRVLVGTESGLFRSTDSGASWVPWGAGLPAAPSVRAIAFDQGAYGTIYAGIWEQGVYKSYDGGAHWLPLNTGLPDLKVYSLCYDQTRRTLYVGTRLRGVFAYTIPATDAPPPPESSAPRLTLEAGPNPARGRVDVRYAIPGTGAASLAVFDARGTRVRLLAEGPAGDAARTVAWDGRDQAGRRVPGGVYWLRLDAPQATQSLKLIWVR